jgi:chitinase
MNGRTDSGEYFTQDDFQTVLDYATGHHMARFTFWSLNRDRQCNPRDNNGQVSGVCSSVPQADWDFAKYSVQFATGASSGTPPTAPTATPTDSPTTSPTGAACSVAAWSGSAVYTAGDEVSYDGHTWKAKWWTQGEQPGTTGQYGVWQDEGTC